MFGIGPMELLVIAIVAIVFVGPQRLPEMMRKFGRMFVQVRRQTQDIRNSFNDVIRDAEREFELERIRDLKKQVDQVKNQNLLDVAAKEINKAEQGQDQAANTDQNAADKDKAKKDPDYEYHESHYIDGEFVRTDGDNAPEDLVNYAKLRAKEQEEKQQAEEAAAKNKSDQDSSQNSANPGVVSTSAPQTRSSDTDEPPSFDTPLDADSKKPDKS